MKRCESRPQIDGALAAYRARILWPLVLPASAGDAFAKEFPDRLSYETSSGRHQLLDFRPQLGLS